LAGGLLGGSRHLRRHQESYDVREVTTRTVPNSNCHHRKFKETLDRERRSFLKSSFAAPGRAAMTGGGISLVTPQMAAAARRTTGQAGPITIARECRHGALGLFQQRS